MADDRDPAAPPSLEPPSLFRRRRKARPEPVQEPVEESAVDEEPTEVIEPAPPPTEVLDPVPPPASPEPEPVAAPAPPPAPQPEPVPVAAAEEAPPLFADEVEPEPAAVVPEPESGPEPERPRAPRPPRKARGPLLTGLPAAAVTGALVGLLVVLLTAGGQRGCEAVQGTSSCGGAGYPMVLAILVVAVIAGGALLRWSQVPDPTSTSFLGVGLLAVIALLVLVESLDSWWMLLVVPAVSTLTYAGSHWVTTAVIEPARE